MSTPKLLATALTLSLIVATSALAQGGLGSVQAFSQELDRFLANAPAGIDPATLLQDSPEITGLENGAGYNWDIQAGKFDFFHGGQRVVDTRLQIPTDLWREGSGISNFAGGTITADGYEGLVHDMNYAAIFARALGPGEATIHPWLRPPAEELASLNEQVIRIYGEGYSARPLSFAADFAGNRIKIYELSLNGTPVAIQFGDQFYGLPLGTPIGVPTGLRNTLRPLPKDCGILIDCVVPLTYFPLYQNEDPKLTVTIPRNCQPAVTQATGNCVLSSIGVAQIINPDQPKPQFRGTALMMDRNGYLALTANHVAQGLFADGDRAFGVSNHLRLAQPVYVPINHNSYKSAGILDGINVDLGIFRFKTQFDHDPDNAGGVVAHPILNTRHTDAIRPGLPLVGVGFGLNSEIGGLGASDGARRTGLLNVISCTEVHIEKWREKCQSGLYFVTKADPSQRTVIGSSDNKPAANPNQACDNDSGSPAYAQMQDGTLAAVGIISKVAKQGRQCGDFALAVNLTHPTVQAWILRQLAAPGDTMDVTKAKNLTPDGAPPRRTPFAVVSGNSHIGSP